MVQIIQRQREHPSVAIGKQLGGIGQAANQAYAQHLQGKATAEENAALKKQGIDLSGIKDPKIRAAIAAETLKGNLKLKNQLALQEDIGKSYAALEDREPEPYRQPSALDEGVESPDEGGQSKKPVIPRKQEKRFPEVDIAKQSVVNPARATAMQKHNDRIDKNERQDQINAAADKKLEYTKKRDIHLESKKYHEQLIEDAKEAHSANRSLKRQEDLVGEVGWRDRAISLFKPKFQALFQSSDAAKLESNIAEQIASKKNKLGGILTTAKLNLLLNKMVTSAKSEEANRYIIEYNMLENDLTIAQNDIANEIIEENDGHRPANFAGKVNQRMQMLYADRAEDLYNKIQSLPDDPKQLEKVWRRKVPQGTPMNADIVKKYREMYGANAQIEAEKDGYDPFTKPTK